LEEQLAVLKQFATWFRSLFPYYYDQCGLCGNRDKNEYLGCLFSNAQERQYDSSRTELYHCDKCQHVTRFARYNTMSKVLETRQGRCGEYSVLMMLFLKALHYTVRYVLDRDDHVWTEALLQGSQWVHVDPCEAAVNEPLIYQGWGKLPTFIIAYAAEDIVDATFTYTDNATAVWTRREAEGITVSVFEEMMTKAQSQLAALNNTSS